MTFAPLLLLLGCGARRGPQGMDDDPTLGLVAFPRTYEYLLVTQPPDGTSESRRYATSWERPSSVPMGRRSAIHERTPDAGPEGRTITVVAGSRGLAIVAVDGVPAIPDMVLLPAGARAGDHWEASHDIGPTHLVRSCTVEASPFCDGGLASRCSSRFGDRTVDERRHFCAGLGQVAVEGRVLPASQRKWTRYRHDKVVIDGIPAPAVDAGDRGLE